MLDYSDILQELFPESPLFDPAPGEGLDQFFDGWAENEITVYEFLWALAHIRDPYRTPVLEALEREMGQITNTTLTEEFRRLYLAALMYSKVGNGDRDFLQDRLRQAGFDVYVYENNPRSDPRHFLNGGYLMYAGDTLAQAGEPGAQAGACVGELLVNGDLFETYVDYLVGAGDTLSQAGEPDMIAGNFGGMIKRPIEYEVPSDEKYWPAILYVGGPAVFAPTEPLAPMLAGDTLAQAGEPGAYAGIWLGQMISIDFANIPNERRDQFRKLILKIKPLHSWAALVVNYV
jgi:hypothetical protein